MQHFKKLFSLLKDKNTTIDIYDYMDALWLAKQLSKENLYHQETKNKTDNLLPMDERIEIESKDITKENNTPKQLYIEPVKNQLKKDLKVTKKEYHFDKTTKNDDIVEAKLETSFYKAFYLSKALKLLNKKVYFLNKKKIDENKTANFIAETKVYQPIYKKDSHREFSISLIVDIGKSMFLWDEIIETFTKQLSYASPFYKINILYIDTSKQNSLLYKDKTKNSKTSIKQEVYLQDKKNIILILSDCISSAWKSNDIFKNIIHPLSKKTFLAIVQILPSYMWAKSTLGRGVFSNFYTKYQNPTNEKLLFDDYLFEDEDNSTLLKLPILSLESKSLQNLTKVIVAKDGNSINGVVLDDYMITKEVKEQPKLSSDERFDYFNSVASIDAQKLAIYCSVLPLTFDIIKKIQRLKNIQKDIDIVSELYFGKIIYYNEEIKQFRFYEGVGSRFRELLDTKEAFNLAILLSDEIQKAFSLPVGYKELFYYSTKGKLSKLSEHEKEIIDIFIDTLKRRGGKFRKKASEIDSYLLDLEDKVKNYLKDREFEEIWNETVYIGGNPKDGDYIEGTVSQYGTFEDNIEFLDINEVDKNHYNIQASFGTLCFVEIYDYPYPPLTKEVELYLDVEATFKIKLVSYEIDEIHIENITIDDVDISQLDDLIRDEEEQEKTQAIIPQSKRFQMGSSDGDDDEKPVHEVVINYDFEISKYPVTFEEYDLFCEDTGREKPDDKGWGRGRRPVINVSWHDAKAYCEWLNKKLGLDEKTGYYRLPTEAEWEYSCRAGTMTKWSFGDDEKELTKYAWCRENSDSKTHPVGEKEPNPWGLYDMHGNVWEWCEDDWVGSYEKTPRDGSAYEDKSSGYKVLRGGSWFNVASDTRSSFRDRLIPVDLDFIRGFRLLRVIKGKGESEK